MVIENKAQLYAITLWNIVNQYFALNIILIKSDRTDAERKKRIQISNRMASFLEEMM